VLHMADRIWTHAGFTYRDDFMSILRDRYRAPLGELDFEQAPEPARATINAWVEKQTRGRIRGLLPPESIDRTTRLVLTNAVYFKGSWLLPFAPGSTLEEDFATPKAKVHAKMMRQLTHFGYARLDGVALVELPYFGGSISMVVILPEAESGLADVENRIGRDYDGWMTAFVDKKVDLWLPRWTETRTIVLNAILKALGMPLAFERSADFSGMTDVPARDPGKFYIGAVIQKAFVDVDEFGTEAAAATANMMASPMSLRESPPEPEPVVFHADHPFLYVIRERKTGAVLFVGRVVDPR
ncbi:MAG: serpin family protein, partial [Myxococcota bacterium]|nr:serpin family protein [Myxococcota bacterium]